MADMNPETDLEIERMIRAAPETIWRCWSEPDLFRQWFTPPGVEVTECENVLEPGGRAFCVMKLPDGALIPGTGVFFSPSIRGGSSTPTRCWPGSSPRARLSCAWTSR